ncbi:hypothetical protein DRQ00_00675 [candidate division KSB1 bacterium]|nr:MAG: hypothetical protein DRQ00_00675 [candidate division KSB1 bacterium]
MTDRSIYNKSTLTNGIRVISEQIPHVRSVSIGVWIIAGSRDETEENNGIAHFIEHMAFKGTQKRKTYEIAEALESVGGHLNAFTSKELTCFYAHVLDENLNMAVDVLSDIVLNSLFSEEEIEKEKNVVIEEINDLEDSPDELIHEYFVRDLYYPHPLSFSILGKRENVQNYHRDDLLDFIKQNYTPNRILIAAAGNVNHKALVEICDKYFGNYRNNSLSNRQLLKIPEEKPKISVIENPNINQAHICIGARSVEYTNPKKFSLLVLNTILGSGMSSRLFQSVRETHGIAYSVYSFFDFLMDTGMFGVYIATDRNKIDQAISLTKSEFERLKTEPIPKEELQKRKYQLKGNLMLGLEGTANRMNRLAKMGIYLDTFVTLDDTLNYIDKVTSPDILEAANELFTPEKLYTTILKPTNNQP